mgnify:CR=1 FL=1
MLDIKLIRENVEEVIRRLNTRGGDFSYLRTLKEKDERKRELLVVVENLKSERNQKSKLIGEIKRAKGDASEVMASVANIGDEIKKYESELVVLEEEIRHMLLTTPNLVALDTKVGKDETEKLVKEGKIKVERLV